eukprot:3270-Heterococcus_DN1.PRE.2
MRWSREDLNNPPSDLRACCSELLLKALGHSTKSSYGVFALDATTDEHLGLSAELGYIKKESALRDLVAREDINDPCEE